MASSGRLARCLMKSAMSLRLTPSALPRLISRVANPSLSVLPELAWLLFLCFSTFIFLSFFGRSLNTISCTASMGSRPSGVIFSISVSASSSHMRTSFLSRGFTSETEIPSFPALPVLPILCR